MTAHALKRWVAALTAGIVGISAATAFAQAPPDLGDDEVVENIIGQIGKKRARQGQTLTFEVVSASAPDPGIQLIATDLPPGAAFTDLGNGYGLFTWTPVTGQEGEYAPVFSERPAGKSIPAGGAPVPVVVGGYPLSHGWYRIPYGDGEPIRVSRDHVTHTPPIKEDWVAVGGGPTQQIPVVAAADGRIRSIVDDNTNCCADKDNDINCSACNNSVWIEHSNGEWTKYSHFQTGTVTSPFVANLDTNDCVVQGQLLGYEGQIGHTSGNDALQTMCSEPLVDSSKRCGIHLHWEVRYNQDADFLRVPILCGVDGWIAFAGDTILAAQCNGFGCETDVVIGNGVIGGSAMSVTTADNSITSEGIYTGSTSTAYFAGNRITLQPGFAARTGTYFHAMIKSCESSSSGCPPQ